MRAKTEALEREAMREAIRATSEIRRDLTPAPRTEEERQASRYIDEAHRRADQVITRHRSVCVRQNKLQRLRYSCNAINQSPQFLPLIEE